MTEEAEFLFAQAKVMHKAGRLAEAIALYAKAVALKPDYAEAHNNLGNALGEARRFEEAAASLGRAAELRPDLAAIHSNLGLALSRLKRFEEAAACHRCALDLDPAMAPAHSNLAMALRELERLDESAEHHRRAIALKPDVPAFHFNLGNVLSDLGELDSATEAYRHAIALRGDFAEAHSGLAGVLAKQERYDEAIACFQGAIEASPRLLGAHTGLGTVLMELDRPAEAAESFRHAIALDPASASAYGHLASALREMEETEAALAAYARAVELDPGFAAAHFNRGNLLLELGRNGEALEAFDRTIAADSRMSAAYLSRLHSLTGAPDESEAARIEAALVGAHDRPPAERSLLHFALGTVREAQGRFDEAFASFMQANSLRRPSIDYDEAASAERFARIGTVFDEPMLTRNAGAGSDSGLPVFIVGMARSGSSLVEQVLASHPAVHGEGERPHLPRLLTTIRLADGSPGVFPECLKEFMPAGFRVLGDAYAGLLAERNAEATRITDKYLDNFAHAGLIHLALPRARILHVMRDPLDTCLSAYALAFSRNAQAHSYELGELGRRYRLYADLMARWRRLLPPEAMLDIRYEDLVSDMEGGVRRVLEYCGLPWDERCLAFHNLDRAVRTSSVSQVRQKVYRTSIGRWRRYRAHLGPLIEALGPYAPADA